MGLQQRSIPAPEGARLRGPGPRRTLAGQSAWALLPALALGAAILWIGAPALRKRLAAPADVASARSGEVRPELEHVGFEAQAERGGTELRVRLAPLHAAPARQAFDARSLGRLLGLEGGMPWRLELSRGGPESAGAPAQGAESAPRLNMNVDIQDPGAGFRPLPLERLDPRSPLVPLLSPSERSLGAGQTGSIILWGPEKAGSPRLVGLGEDLELAAATWEAAGEDEALMRLEPLQ